MPLPYLQDTCDSGYDITLDVELKGTYIYISLHTLICLAAVVFKLIALLMII